MCDPVHPHACGEHSLEAFRTQALYGSSPRLWGTCLCRRTRKRKIRFIPTPVGNISPSRSKTALPSVHPHACGEHIDAIRDAHGAPGSSPRLWGTLEYHEQAREPPRFIPTPVGNITVITLKGKPVSVHPHACGEHCLPNNASAFDAGSSPRLWGTCALCGLAFAVIRFIPTPVGNMCRTPVLLMPLSVHPHACGEHIQNCVIGFHDTGSSPRLWGTYGECVRGQDRRRFIPTPVGNILLITC